jgi:small subunit ribosomal protein S7
MPRRKTAVLAREKKPDQYFNSVEVEMMNRLMTKDGKYQKACKIVRESLEAVFDSQVKGGIYRKQPKQSSDRGDRGDRGDRSVGRYDKFASAKQEVDEQLEFNLNEMDRKQAIIVILDDVLERAGPELELISKRIGGANIQVPVVVKQGRRTTLAIRTIVKNARTRIKQMKSMASALAAEIQDIIKGQAKTLVDKENLLKMARANAVYSGIRR